MVTPRNIAFTSLIKLDGRLKELNFRKRGETVYDGDTNDDRGNRYFFKMEKQEGEWKIGGINLPDWLIRNERLIANAINSEE